MGVHNVLKSFRRSLKLCQDRELKIVLENFLVVLERILVTLKRSVESFVAGLVEVGLRAKNQGLDRYQHLRKKEERAIIKTTRLTKICFPFFIVLTS